MENYYLEEYSKEEMQDLTSKPGQWIEDVRWHVNKKGKRVKKKVKFWMSEKLMLNMQAAQLESDKAFDHRVERWANEYCKSLKPRKIKTRFSK